MHPNAVQTHLLALTKNGYVRRRRREARGLRLVRDASFRKDNGKATVLAPPPVTVPPNNSGLPVDPPGGAESYRNSDGSAALLILPKMVEPARITHGGSQSRVCDFGEMLHRLVKWHPSRQGLWLAVSLWRYG